jgi:hypothetical protein
MRYLTLLILFTSLFTYGQKTSVSGQVTDLETGEAIPFANVFFKDSKIGTETDFDGNFELSSYYATDSLVVRFSGYKTAVVAVVKDQAQVINFRLETITQDIDEVVIKAPTEKPSTRLYNRVVKNKPINNKQKLGAYEYESYNKIQLDLNNIGDKFEDRKIVKSLDVVMNYLDTAGGDKYLPLLLSESLSDYYYRTNPKKKKEVVKASRITGIQNVEVNQFLGEMYQDINVYENYIGIFDKSFISPISDFAMSFYKFYMEDSSFIDNQWCYELKFIPKRKGDLTFTGSLWIHDTTYAVKKWRAEVAETANINYVKGFLLEQDFDQVEDEVWMLTLDKLLVELKVTQKSKVIGFYGHKLTSRKDFVINTPYDPEFYRSNENVVVLDSAELRTPQYWKANRHFPLNTQETNIDAMIDSLNEVPLFNAFKNLTFLATTGFYPFKKIEVGNIQSLMSFNQVEGFRNQLQLRTSNDFSRRIELSGKLAYGYLDQTFKYGGKIRYNVTPKKRGMLSVFYDYDLTQLGLGENAADADAALGAFFRTQPLNQLTFVEKVGFSFEKDFGKSYIISAGATWKELESMGDANYRLAQSGGTTTLIDKIATFETFFEVRFAKNEEFLAGSFDRISLGSKYPIFTLRGTAGIKDVVGSDYNYQKAELSMEHNPKIGIFGKLNYEIYGGYIFGTAAYPFLKVHEGSQSYWFQSGAHNRMDFFEFISDRYVGAHVEHHFDGLVFDRIPLIRQLHWRLVATGKGVWGDISDRQIETMLLPTGWRSFGNTPYVETSIGIENIFKVLRFDAVWRATHRDEGVPPVSIRGKLVIRF